MGKRAETITDLGNGVWLVVVPNNLYGYELWRWRTAEASQNFETRGGARAALARGTVKWEHRPELGGLEPLEKET